MKKVIFMALATVFMLSSGFAGIDQNSFDGYQSLDKTISCQYGVYNSRGERLD